MPYLFLLLLPLAIILSWCLTIFIRLQNQVDKKLTKKLQSTYLTGLNYLLDNKPDKFVDNFIKVIQIDKDTFEAHLALGIVFRRQGEFERAIHIHQSLVAKPQLTRQLRIEAMLELGKDYLCAGMLDRAEGLFLEVVELGEQVKDALSYLLDIYQQEKNWLLAIATAEKIRRSIKQDMRPAIANYYCELALQAKQRAESSSVVYKYLEKASEIDSKSVRASLLLAELEMRAQNYLAAIKLYLGVKRQDIAYLTEVIEPLAICCRQLNREKDLISYLHEFYNLLPNPRFAVAIARHMQSKAAYDFLLEQIQLHPSLQGIIALFKIKSTLQPEFQSDLIVINQLLEKFYQTKASYQCVKCGYKDKALTWLCPSCRTWNTVKPINQLEI